ncbi:MAG: DUF4202 domain-containing protein [Candidatus Hydrogenedentota bacterium]
MHDDRLKRALTAIDAVNAQDPTPAPATGEPRALSYGRRMTGWLTQLRPDAPEALEIACRAQHIRRWDIPRTTFPEGRQGYLAWRRRLYTHHAEVTAGVLENLGFDADTIARVGFLLNKKHIKHDPDSQSLEDAACLVFLENDLASFADKTDRDKMRGILRKTWNKMSDQAQEHARALSIPPEAQALMDGAIDPEDVA